MLDGSSYYYGELAALSAAFLWALASVLYGRIGQYLAPLKMNLLKNIIAMAMAMMVLAGKGGLFAGIDRYSMSLLLLSGAVASGWAIRPTLGPSGISAPAARC